MPGRAAREMETVRPDSAQSSKRLLSYETALGDLVEADIAKAHELSIGVSWPHRPEDWQLLLGLGHGIVACDEIGRAVGTAMWFPHGDDFAMIGMLITSPRLQALGAGRWLMQNVFDRCGERDFRLNATRAAYRLYTSLDFKPVGVIFQHQGRAEAPAAPDPAAGWSVRPVSRGDLAVVTALDAAAYGVERRRVVEALMAQSAGSLLEIDGAPAGYALCRSFGRGRVVGPIVAPDDAAAIALTAPHLVEHAGTFMRVDTPQENSAFGAFLQAAGLPVYDTVTTMTLGAHRPPSGAARTFGLASQALG